MRVVVVGAGIAGLTLAAALTRDGARVTVLEQAHDPAPAGAGVLLTPAALHPLRRLGLGAELERAGVRLRSRDALGRYDDRLLHSTVLGGEAAEHRGTPSLGLLRADLHRALRAVVPAEAVRTGRYVTDLLENSDGVTLRCADGRHVHGDVAIGADGANSLIRGLLDSDRFPPALRLVYRGLVPTARAPEPCARARMAVWAGGDRYLACFPVTGGEQVSFTAAVPAGSRGPSSWTVRGRIGDLAAAFRGWSATVLDLVAAADRVGVHEAHDRAPAAVWHRGRIALVGDAAHPTLPFFAQSTDQAVEDAVALADCLRDADSLTAGHALEHYAAARKSRTDRLHTATRAIADTLRDADTDSSGAWLRAVAEAEDADADRLCGLDPDHDRPRPAGPVGADPAAG